VKPNLRVIAGRPIVTKTTMQQKLEKAINYLRERGIYVLDQGSPKPKWGHGRQA